MLHNFGGNLEMYGRLDVVGAGPIEALTNPNSTMVVSLNFWGPFFNHRTFPSGSLLDKQPRKEVLSNMGTERYY